MDTMNYDSLSTFCYRKRAWPGRVSPTSGRVIRPRPGAPR